MKACRLSILLLCLMSSHIFANRYQQYTQKWNDPEDKATPLAATFLGGSGNEWLAAGAFKKDGSVIVAGNFIGPTFSIDKVRVHILGKDGEKPVELTRRPQMYGSRVKKNKDGSTRYHDPGWKDKGATGFIAHLSADLKKVYSISRLPWTSGVITDVKIDQYGIYICGKAGENLTDMAVKAKVFDGSDKSRTKGACSETFIAKLTNDLKKIEWLNHIKGFSNAPKLKVDDKGSIILKAHDIRYFSADGKLSKILKIGAGHLVDVNLKNGTYVRGGEHHSRTGREPWRCPTLNIYKLNGELIYQLYDPLGPYVGLDNCRLVSDTAVRRVEYGPDGDLLVYFWSDGGNSIALTEPMDVRRQSPKINGLGFSAWGANVLSCSYIVKINPETLKASAGTLWLGYQKTRNKPSSARIGNLNFAIDQSVCFEGGAENVIQTGNKLSAKSSGSTITILRDDLKSIRFCSVIPGGGIIEIGNGEERWGICSGIVNGKQRVLYLSGANNGTKDFKTPLVNARQSFGGGYSDGYMVLLEMDINKVSTQEAASTAQKFKSERSGIREAKLADFYTKKKGNRPARGPVKNQVFEFKSPKWVTVDAEFRSENEEIWPTFYYGKPESGNFVFDVPRPKTYFQVKCDRVVQPAGDQSRRILGELNPPKGQPLDFSFKVTNIGNIFSFKESYMFRGKVRSRDKQAAPVKAIMTLAGKSYKINGEATFHFSYGKDATKPNKVQFNVNFDLDAKTLGLKKHSGIIKARVSACAYPKK